MHYIILCSTKDLHDTDLFHSSHLIELVQNTHSDGHTHNVTFLEIIMTSKEIATFYGITAENRIKVYSLKSVGSLSMREIRAIQSDIVSSDESRYIHERVFGLFVLLSQSPCQKIISNWIVD